MIDADFWTRIIKWLTSTGLEIAAILIFTGIAMWIVKFISDKFLNMLLKKKKSAEAKKRADTLSTVLRHLLRISILITATMMILGTLDIEIGPLLGAAGIVGVAIGFGAQSLVKDIISGFFILLEEEIRVGDVVKIGDNAGVVEKVNLRLTVLRDLGGNVHFIPNGMIDVVTNMTKDFSYYVMDIGVAYKEDIDRVMAVIREIDEDLRRDPEFVDDIIEPVEILGLDQFADSAIIIKARIKSKPIKQWRVGREFNRRMKRKFDEKNIEIPFPQRTLHLGQKDVLKFFATEKSPAQQGDTDRE